MKTFREYLDSIMEEGDGAAPTNSTTETGVKEISELPPVDKKRKKRDVDSTDSTVTTR